MARVANQSAKQSVKFSSSERQRIDKPTRTAASGLSAQVLDLRGKAAGSVALPKEIFGQEVNRKLLAQAYRVYFTNDSSHKAHTKTKGEVRGGGAKPWRQKGTGRARAGSIRSPLWVGGGITFGPRFRDVELSLPKKMKHKALISALSQKSKEGKVKVVASIEKVEPKTKSVAQLFKSFPGKTLLVISGKNQNLKLATRNIQDVDLEIASNLNAYKILETTNLLISREALRQIK